MSEPATEPEKTKGTGDESVYAVLEQALAGSGPDRAFDELANKLEKDQKYPELFEVLVMKSRRQLGLPLIQIGLATDIPDELVEPHEEAIAEACRRVGQLFLRDGDLGKAWPYLRAVGESKSVSETIGGIEPGTRRKDIDQIIEIAINEGVHPERGLEMVVQHYGICSAITNFEQFNLNMRQSDQESGARVLMDALYKDLLDNIRGVVEEHSDGQVPDHGLIALIDSRPDLFEADSYFIDTSHLWSVVRFCSFLSQPADLRKAIELTEYGNRLSSMYKYDSEAPFEDFYPDHRVYFEGILANTEGDADTAKKAAEHFIEKARVAIAAKTEGYPSRGVLTLLSRIGCLREAIDLALQFEATEGMGRCHSPSVYELCQLAGDYERLTEIARERDEPVAFAAGIIQKTSNGK